MLWLAQAAQSGGVAGQTSGAAVERALADFTSVLGAAGLSLILIILVCVNIRLAFRVYASSLNSCGCSECRGRSMCQVLLGAALNTVAFFLSAWRHVDTIGPQGHPVSDAATSTDTGSMVQLESQTISCGGAWERELSSALAKK